MCPDSDKLIRLAAPPDRAPKPERRPRTLRDVDGWVYRSTNVIGQPSDIRNLKLTHPVAPTKRLDTPKH